MTGNATEAAASHMEGVGGASVAVPGAPYGSEAGHLTAGDGGGLLGVQLRSVDMPRALYGTEVQYADQVSAGNGGGLVGVQGLLTAAFPPCTDLSCDPERGIDGFVPHLSLGQIRVGGLPIETRVGN